MSYETNPIGLSNSSTTSSTTGFTCDELLETMRLARAKFDALEKEHLRRSAEMVEQTTCGVCGRKPTVTQDGYGETIVVCPHIWEALWKHVKPAEPHRSPSLYPGPLGGVRFEVFDDGPARW